MTRFLPFLLILSACAQRPAHAFPLFHRRHHKQAQPQALFHAQSVDACTVAIVGRYEFSKVVPCGSSNPR